MNARAKRRGVKVMFLMLSLAALSCRESNTKESEDPRPGPESTNSTPVRDRLDADPSDEGADLNVSGTLYSKPFTASDMFAEVVSNLGGPKIWIGFYAAGGRMHSSLCNHSSPKITATKGLPTKEMVSVSLPASAKKGQTIAYSMAWSPDSLGATYTTLNHPGSEGDPVDSMFREGKVTILDISETSVSGRLELANPSKGSRVSGTFKVPIQPCPKK